MTSWLFGGDPTATSNATAEGFRAAPDPCLPYRLEPGLDYLGGDLGTQAVSADGREACCAACERAELCNAFTFVESRRECWLKVGRRRARHVEDSDAAVVSGHRGRLRSRRRSLQGGLRSLGSAPPASLGSRIGAVAFHSLQRPPFGTAGRSGGGRLQATLDALRRQHEVQADALLRRASPIWREASDADLEGHPALSLLISAVSNNRSAGRAPSSVRISWACTRTRCDSSPALAFGHVPGPAEAWTTVRMVRRPWAQRARPAATHGRGCQRRRSLRRCPY